MELKNTHSEELRESKEKINSQQRQLKAYVMDEDLSKSEHLKELKVTHIIRFEAY